MAPLFLRGLFGQPGTLEMDAMCQYDPVPVLQGPDRAAHSRHGGDHARQHLFIEFRGSDRSLGGPDDLADQSADLPLRPFDELRVKGVWTPREKLARHTANV